MPPNEFCDRAGFNHLASWIRIPRSSNLESSKDYRIDSAVKAQKKRDRDGERELVLFESRFLATTLGACKCVHKSSLKVGS